MISMMSRTPLILFAVAIAVALAPPAAPSQAELIGPLTPPTITISIDGVPGPAWEWSPALDLFNQLPGRPHGRELAAQRAFQGILGNRANVEITELEFAPDPFVVNNILITNTTAVTQTFTVGVTLPTTFPAPNIIFGEVHTAIIDGGGAPGATVATAGPGQPIYSAQIDFATVATLQDHPFSLTASPASTANATASFGPNVNLVPVTSNIGIQLRFSLTAGDTVAILSRFDVVPEPASAGLGALALIALAIGWRRRR